MRAIGNFGVPALLGGEFYVLPTLIYFEVTGSFNLHGAGAIALVSTLFSIGSLMALRWITGRGGFVTVTSQARAVQQSAHPAARWLEFGTRWRRWPVPDLQAPRQELPGADRILIEHRSNTECHRAFPSGLADAPASVLRTKGMCT